MSIRAWHNSLSLLIAPAIIFFALTGALQLYGLHETHGSYEAPRLLQMLGRLHKDQVVTVPRPDVGAAGGGRATLVLKAFFCLCAVLFSGTAGLGIWIGMAARRRRRASLALLAAGTLIPLACVLSASGGI